MVQKLRAGTPVLGMRGADQPHWRRVTRNDNGSDGARRMSAVP
jgi:hypothetical protein